MAEPLSADQRSRLDLEVSRAFSPTAPIDERTLFAGRQAQVRHLVDAVNQRGQHAMIFGERGVGKTSLANVLADFLWHPNTPVLAIRINCETGDSLDSLWRKVFEQVELRRLEQSAGFDSPETVALLTAADTLIPNRDERPITADDVRRALTVLARSSIPVAVLDEFDRLEKRPKRAIADTIKTLSDHSVGATVVLVGVADSVDELIEEHQSVERALVQVRMPRMSATEIEELIHKGLSRLDMQIEAAALDRIVMLAQGLPPYAHLIGLSAARAAIQEGRLDIHLADVERAITQALENAQQSTRSLYHKATMSPRKDNLFGAVLLSCALAKTDELGYFKAQDLREPMRRITGKPYDIPSYSQHLNEFCEEKRGPILQRTGSRRRYAFRFVTPLMQPYVIMKGFADGVLENTEDVPA